MSRARPVVGIIAGVILLLSSAAHAFGGWPAMRERLAAVNAPAELITGLGVGWLFGSVCIVVFGVIAIGTFTALLRGRLVPRWPVALIGAAYALFGIGAYVVSRRDPFFMVFIVPGLMLLGAAWPTRPSLAARPYAERVG